MNAILRWLFDIVRRLSRTLDGAAACAGLVVAGDLHGAVEGIFADDIALRGKTGRDAETFASAVKASPALAEMLRFSLSDFFLALYARGMQSQ